MIASKREIIQFRVTHLGGIATSTYHGHQVVRESNDEPGPRFVCGSKGNSASELLFKSSIKQSNKY